MNDRRFFYLSCEHLAALSGCVALSGCAHYQPQPLVPEQTAVTLESRSLADPGLREFIERNRGRPLDTWPLKRWNQELLTLAAFYYNPALSVARSQWKVAQAGVLTARGRPNPTLNLTPEFSTNPPAGFSPWLPAIGIDLPIETAGKRGHRIEQAGQLSESARWSIVTSAWEVRHNLRGALLEFTAAQRREGLLNDQVAVQQHIVQLLEERLASGAVAGSDVTVTRIQLARTRLDLQATRSQLADARTQVANALGISLSGLTDAQLVYDFEQTGSADLTSEDSRRSALQSRSDVLSSLADYAAAQAALQLEIARQYPDVHLGPGYQWDEGENKWHVGISVELPVFNRNQGPIAEATARREEASARFLALQAKVINEIDRAAAAFRVAEDSSKAGETLLTSQRQNLQSMQAQLKEGAIDALELTTTRLELLGAEALAFDAHVRQQEALAELENAVQRPLGSDETARATRTQIESTQRSPQ